jgi:putative peptidoglycan lipid II flippase
VTTEAGPPPARERARAQGIGRAALLLAASSLASRALGLVREGTLSHLAGAGGATDAYFAAFRIPDFMNHVLIGGALSIAFVPLYTRTLERRGEAAATRLFHTVLGTLTLAAVVIAALVYVFAAPLVGWLYGKFAPDVLALTVEITRIVVPAQVMFVAGGVLNGVLLASGRFGALALSPLIYNVAIIAVGASLYSLLGIKSFAWGVALGAVAGPLLVPLIGAAKRLPIRLRIAPFDRDFREYLWLALPFMVGFTLLTVDEWYETIVGARLAEGSVSHLTYARKIMLVPVGAIGQAIGAAALPALAQLFAEGRTAQLNQTLVGNLRAGVFLALLVAGGTALLAAPAVSLAFQRGSFSAADTAEVAPLLVILAASIPGWILQQITVRSFYARGDTWRPMLIGTALSIAAAPLYLSLGALLDKEGLALASALSMNVNAVITLWITRRLHGIELAPLAESTLRGVLMATIAAAAAAAIVALVFGPVALRPATPIGPLAACWLLALGGGIYLLASAAVTMRAGDAPARAVMARLLARPSRSREGRKRTPPPASPP